MKKQIIMLHKDGVHLFWTGGQSAALCQQPKPTHNSPKDDYANASQPAIFPGRGEGLLVEAIIVPQSCGKTSKFFFS